MFLLFSFGIVCVHLFLCFFWKCRYTPWDYDHTTILKGIGIITVLWCHSGRGYGVHGIQWVAAIGVGTFLFLSGYGLTHSQESIGEGAFWKKRFIRVFIPYWVVSLFLGVIWRESWIERFKTISIILSPQWYISYLFICYMIFWIVFYLLRCRRIVYRLVLMLFLFAIWLIVDSFFFPTLDAPFLRSRQMLCFCGGVIFYYLKKNIPAIRSLLNGENKKACFFAFVSCVIMFVVAMALVYGYIGVLIPNLILAMISIGTVFPAVIALILLSVIWPQLIRNKAVIFLGTISYEIYLCQYYIQRIIKTNDMKSLALYWFLSIVGAVLLHYSIKSIRAKKGHGQESHIS